jgi:glycosyltransferase involved in cell wall biosynthesis
MLSVSTAGQPGLDLSVVLPVFEEQERIEALLHDLVQTLQATGRSFEVIAVDDGSSDATAEALQRALDAAPGVLRVARHLQNRGNGAALRTGIRLAQGELVVTMDADGQHNPADIAGLLEQIPPYDLVVGARTQGYRGSWYRGLANGFYNRFASWLTRRPIADLTSGFRAMRREVVNHFLPLFPEGFSAPTTTTMAFLKAGYNVTFVPIQVGQRTAGQSKIRLWRDGARFLTIILRMIMLYDPLRIFLPVGSWLAVLGLAAWIAGLWAAGRLVVPNSAIFLFSAALMTWLLGLVSDQIAGSRVQYHGDETIYLLEAQHDLAP